MKGMNNQYQQAGNQGFGGRGQGRQESDEGQEVLNAAEQTPEGNEEGAQPGHGGGHRGPGGHRGERPEPEDIAQENVVNEDGSVTIKVTVTDHEGELHTKSVTVSDNEKGGIDILSESEEGRSKQVTVSEDEDGGVDLDITCVKEDGETVSRHIELDMNDDGTVHLEEFFTDSDGVEQSISHDFDLARLLGDEDEELNVYEVVEGYLERGPIDLTDVDLTGLNNMDSGFQDLLIV